MQTKKPNRERKRAGFFRIQPNYPSNSPSFLQSKTIMHPKSRPLVLSLTLLGFVTVWSAQAATYEWLTDKDGSWSVPTNWFNGIAPPVGGAPDAILVFDSSDFGSDATNDLAGVFSLNQMTFNHDGSDILTVNSNSGSSLLFTGTNPLIDVAGMGSSVLSNGVSLDADVSINMGLGTLDISSNLSGTHGITVSGAEEGYPLGLVNFSSGDSSFSGGVTLESGNLGLGSAFSDTPFGTGPLTINGGYLAINAGSSKVNTPLILNSDLSILSTYYLVYLNGPITVGNSNINFLQQGGAVYLQTPLDIQGATVIGRDLNYYSATYSGGLILSENTANGVTTHGTLLQTSSISLLAGASLSINDTAADQNDRVSNTAPITLKSGGIGLNASSAGNSETIGPVTLSGYSIFEAEPGGHGGQAGILTMASLTRVNHGVLVVSGQKLGDSSAQNHGAIFVTAGGPALVGGGGAPGTTTVSIVPWAVADYRTRNVSEAPNSFATYDPASGFRALNPDTEFASTLGTNPNENVFLHTSVTNDTAAMVNSLGFGGAQAITLDGSGSIAITSGALIFTGSADSTINNSLSFGSAEAVITCAGSFDSLTINGSLTGTGGLTKAGAYRLLLTGDNTGVVGPLTINGTTNNSFSASRIDVTSVASLPGTGAITVYSNPLAPAGISVQGNVEINRDIVMASGRVALGVLADTSAAIFSGTLSGPGGPIISPHDSSGYGTVELSGSNTYTGPTKIDLGTLIIHSDASLGASGGLLEFSGYGTSHILRLAGDWTTSRRLILSGPSTIDTAEHTAVLDGVMPSGPVP